MSELPIHDAAIDGDFTELLEALDDGFDVNAVDVEHETALHYAGNVPTLLFSCFSCDQYTHTSFKHVHILIHLN